jgi:hypothetical protein
MCGRQELSHVSLNIIFVIDFVPFSLMQASVSPICELDNLYNL